nr:MAG TPA: restriction alleviation protein [Caudoviricetes sp.]
MPCPICCRTPKLYYWRDASGSWVRLKCRHYSLLEGKAELSWCFKQAALHWNEWVNTIWVSF